MCALELAVTSRYGVAILDAILKYADIRIAFLAYASNDEIGLGNKPKTGELVASVPIISGDGINHFLHLELPPYFCICLFSAGRKTHGLQEKSGIFVIEKGASTGKRKSLRVSRLKTKKSRNGITEFDSFFFV